MIKEAVAAALAMAAGGVASAQQKAPGPPLLLFFDWGKPEVRSDDQAVLDRAVQAWKEQPGVRLVISGHTDRSGGNGVNLRASKRRAETVQLELIKRGVPASAMTLQAFGEQQPLVPTEDGVREVQNRRVEIRVQD